MLYLEKPKSQFANYSEAQASGMMDRGWIPVYIPKSAEKIKEQHDLDTSWVKMSFIYDPSDIEDTRKACESEQEIEGGIEFKCKYFNNNVSVKLFSNGTAALYSSRH